MLNNLTSYLLLHVMAGAVYSMFVPPELKYKTSSVTKYLLLFILFLYNINTINHLYDHECVLPTFRCIEECILNGFPETSDDILVLNYCILYTKYYIFIERLFNNNELDLYVCQTQVKLALNIEHSICKKEMNIKSL